MLPYQYQLFKVFARFFGGGPNIGGPIEVKIWGGPVPPSPIGSCSPGAMVRVGITGELIASLCSILCQAFVYR